MGAPLIGRLLYCNRVSNRNEFFPKHAKICAKRYCLGKVLVHFSTKVKCPKVCKILPTFWGKNGISHCTGPRFMAAPLGQIKCYVFSVKRFLIPWLGGPNILQLGVFWKGF